MEVNAPNVETKYNGTVVLHAGTPMTLRPSLYRNRTSGDCMKDEIFR